MAEGFCRISRISDHGAATSRFVSFHLTISASLSSFFSLFIFLSFFLSFSFAKTTNDDKEGERFVRSDTKSRRLTDPKQERCSLIKDAKVLPFLQGYAFEISTFTVPGIQIRFKS